MQGCPLANSTQNASWKSSSENYPTILPWNMYNICIYIYIHIYIIYIYIVKKVPCQIHLVSTETSRNKQKKTVFRPHRTCWTQQGGASGQSHWRRTSQLTSERGGEACPGNMANMALGIWVPSGYVKIAIENGHL